MDKSNFYSSEDLNIKSDDTMFMARFEHSFSLERRPLPLRQVWTWRSVSEAIGLAIVGAVLLKLLGPMLLSYQGEVKKLVLDNLADSGWSLRQALLVACLAGGTLVAIWPVIREEI